MSHRAAVLLESQGARFQSVRRLQAKHLHRPRRSGESASSGRLRVSGRGAGLPANGVQAVPTDLDFITDEVDALILLTRYTDDSCVVTAVIKDFQYQQGEQLPTIVTCVSEVADGQESGVVAGLIHSLQRSTVHCSTSRPDV